MHSQLPDYYEDICRQFFLGLMLRGTLAEMEKANPTLSLEEAGAKQIEHIKENLDKVFTRVTQNTNVIAQCKKYQARWNDFDFSRLRKAFRAELAREVKKGSPDARQLVAATFPRAVEHCFDESDWGREPPSRQSPQLPADPAETASYWIAAARGLREHAALVTSLKKDVEKWELADRLQSEVQELKGILNRCESFKRDLASVPAKHRTETRLEGQLEEIEKGLHRVGKKLSSTSSAYLTPVNKHIFEQILKPLEKFANFKNWSRWPPIWLAVFFKDSRRHTGPAFSSESLAFGDNELTLEGLCDDLQRHQPPPDDNVLSRILLLKQLVNRVNEERAAKNGKLIEYLKRLCSTLFEDSAFKAVLIGEDYHKYDTSHVDVERKENCSEATLLKIGLAIEGAEGTPAGVVVAHVEEPLPQPAAISKLNDLAEWLGRQPAADRDFINNIELLSDETRGNKTVVDWWESLEARGHKRENRERLWNVISSVTLLTLLDGESPARAAYEAFVEEGFLWKTVEDPQQQKQDAMPVWTIVPLPKGDLEESGVPLPATRQPCGLRAPGKEWVLPPHKWLCVPSDWQDRYPLLRCLKRYESIKHNLSEAIPAWEGWSTWNQILESHQHGEPDAQERNQLAFDLFSQCYQRLTAHDQEGSSELGKIAVALYRCLTKKLAIEICPSVDEETLRPVGSKGILDRERVAQDDIDLVWQKSSKPLGTIREIERFGFGDQRARIRVSLGPEQAGRCVAMDGVF